MNQLTSALTEAQTQLWETSLKIRGSIEEATNQYPCLCISSISIDPSPLKPKPITRKGKTLFSATREKSQNLNFWERYLSSINHERSPPPLRS